MGCFSKIQADGNSPRMWGRCAESGTFSKVFSSARMAIFPSVLTASTARSISRSDMALVPLRTPTGLPALRWFLSGRP
eukprot:4260694-Pyramimonas_sp.AAC.1